MGNCLRRDSANREDEDEDEDEDRVSGGEEKLRLLPAAEAEAGTGVFARSPSGREVKIKITKKELEELLAKVDVQGVTLEHALAQLMACATTSHDTDPPAALAPDMHRQRSWRPALQSIPEGN